MRQIKFRAWDKDSKRMHYAEDLIGPGGWVIQFHGVPLEIGIHSVFERENVKLMQYTGLEDKNGKEIYEGLTIGHGDAAHLISPHRDDLEVIGNIFEHPELIEREAEQ